MGAATNQSGFVGANSVVAGYQRTRQINSRTGLAVNTSVGMKLPALVKRSVAGFATFCGLKANVSKLCSLNLIEFAVCCC